VSDPVLIALIAGLPVTMTAIAGLVVSIRNGRKADRLEVKAQEIHVSTNGHLSKVTAELAAAKKDISEMREVIHNFLNDKKTHTK